MTDWYEEITKPPEVQPSGKDWYKELTQPQADTWDGPGQTVSSGKPSFMAGATDNVSPVDDITKMAGFSGQAIASLPTDPKEKAQYFASRRFPDMNPEEAIAKYGVQDGRVFYEGDDGKYYYEEPGETNLTSFTRRIGQLFGPTIPAAGGIGGGIVGAPAGPAGGMAAAGAGSAAGDAVRQGLAEALIPGEQDYKPSQTIEEGLYGVAGEGIGRGIVALKDRKAVRDIAKFNTPEAQTAIKDLEEKAAEFGMSLTPAEKTDLSSLKGRENFLGSHPRSADTMAEFYKNRNEKELPAAAEKLFKQFSAKESPEVLAASGKAGAEATIKAEQKALQAQAKPYYDSSRNVAIPQEKYIELQKDPLIRQQLKAVAKDPESQSDLGDLLPTEGAKAADFEAKIGYLDVVKKRLDGMEKAAIKTGDDNKARIYRNARQKLLSAIDNEDYTMARSIYEEGMPSVTALTKGEVGLAAKKSPTKMKDVPKTLFNSGEKAIAFNKAAYEKAGAMDQWNDALAGYLRDTFDQASKQNVNGNVNPGAKWRNILIGQKPEKQLKAMQAAMSPDQFQGFTRLMDVLEATGRVPQGGSRTFFAEEQGKEMAKEAGGLAGNAAAVVGVAKIPASLVNGQLARGWQEIANGKHFEKLAKIVTSPDSMKQLKELRSLSPNSKRAAAITALLLTRAGVLSAEDAVFPQRNVAPGGFSGEK